MKGKTMDTPKAMQTYQPGSRLTPAEPKEPAHE